MSRKYRRAQCPNCEHNQEDILCEGSKRKDDETNKWIPWIATFKGKAQKPCIDYKKKTVNKNFGTPIFLTAFQLNEAYK